MSLGPMFDYSDPEGVEQTMSGVNSPGLPMYGGAAAPAAASAGFGASYHGNVNISGMLIVWGVLILGTMFLFHHDRSL